LELLEQVELLVELTVLLAQLLALWELQLSGKLLALLLAQLFVVLLPVQVVLLEQVELLELLVD